jgi:vacuolar-type H+-ATPase subunit H
MILSLKDVRYQRAMEDIEKVKTRALEDIEKAREIAADELEKAKEKAAEELEKARLSQLTSKLPRIR